MGELTANQILRLSQVARGELERDADGNTFFWRDHDWNSRITDPDIGVLEAAGYIDAVDSETLSGGRRRLDVTEAYLDQRQPGSAL